MLLPPDAFAHVPALAGKIIEPEKSFFRLARERYVELDRMAQEQGMPPDWRLSHEAREATRAQALAGRNADLWVFAYGSLMWDPGIHIVEIRRATLHGYHRRFCLKTTLGRGSRERPGLMAALDRGGICHGLALRVPSEHVDRETEILWAREMLAGSYVPSFVAVETPQGNVEALTFEINRGNSRYVTLELEEMARMIANGRGRIGSNLEYLDNLAERLELLGFSDPALDEVRLRARQSLPSL
jgi:cation transport protein ChaC